MSKGRPSRLLSLPGSPGPGDRRDRGASAVEYGLLITGIAALIIAAVFLFGGSVGGLFTNTCDTLKHAQSAASTC